MKFMRRRSVRYTIAQTTNANLCQTNLACLCTYRDGTKEGFDDSEGLAVGILDGA